MVSTATLPTLRTSHERAAGEDRTSRWTETMRAQNYPLSRWYVRPLAVACAVRLTATRVRPWHVTMTGLALALAAAATIVYMPPYAPLAACLLAGYWFCDRLDGPLARGQHTATRQGAWLDANVDELVDLGLHAAVASAAAPSWPSSWQLFAGFVFGKYLLMYGLLVEAPGGNPNTINNDAIDSAPSNKRRLEWARSLYHLPANADVRIHLLAAAMLTGQFVLELAVVALYYNFRWMARYALLARRSGSTSP